MTLSSSHVDRLMPTYPPGQRGALEQAALNPVAVKTITGARTVRAGRVNNVSDTVPTLIIGQDQNRRIVIIKNIGAVDVYLGDRTVAVDSTGYLLAAGEREPLEITAELYAIATSGGVGDVCWIVEVDV